jgi:glutamate-5-semialdehyde dehydrogenase
MSTISTTGSPSSVALAAKSARAAARALARLSNEIRNQVLTAEAEAIEKNKSRILGANFDDCVKAEQLVAKGAMPAAMFARLRVSERGVAEMAERIREVARLDDPLGKRLSAMELDDGLVLYKESCPLGVVGVVFEARPEVVPQVAALALKSGNAILLKGGAEAAQTNETLVAIWRECLAQFPGVPLESIHLLQSRADVDELLSLDRDVDLIIPRGSYELVRYISAQSRIPVLGHGEGICHVYVDRDADIERALKITLDSKTQYPAACNSAETLLVDEAIAKEFLPRAIEMLKSAKVEVRGCPKTMKLLREDGIAPATEEDWSTEYSDLILSVKIVSGLDEAIGHIERYGSRHTETIVTENREAAKRFMDEVDAAGVYQNASTRFADGYRYGLGSELGISNSKLHARGPMGLEGLTTYKWKLFGSGQTVAEYSKGEKTFKHRPIK